MASPQKNKRKLGSYPYLSVVFSTSLSVFVAGLFGVLLILYFNQANLLKNNITVQVYLQKNITDSSLASLKSSLASQEYVRKENNQSKIEYIPKEIAAEKFIKETGEDFVAFLGENPLRDALVLYIDPEYSDANTMKTIKAHIESLNGVFEVNYFENLIETINSNARRIGIVLFLVALLLIVATSLLINNSIRLALYSQRFLIRSMQLVGATSWFIIRPFLWRSILLGFISGILSVLSITLMLIYTHKYLQELELTFEWYNDYSYFLYLAVLMILMGILISFYATYKSVNKYLGMSLDELY